MNIWLVAVLAAWFPVATSVAVLIGRGLRQADLRDRRTYQQQSRAIALTALPERHRQRVSS